MPTRAAKPKAASFQTGQKRALLTAGEFIALMAVLVAAAPAYWSYECRSTGSFCEGSFAAPTVSQATKERVVAKLNSPDGKKKFGGLTIREAGFPPFGKRFDVIASFKDGTSNAVDTIPYSKISEILAVEKDSIAAFLETSTNGNGARMVAYFPTSSIPKREFEFGSVYSSKSTIEISNLSYDAKERTLTLDLVSDEPWVELNNNTSSRFDIRHPAAQIKKKYGATIVIELSDDYHVKRAYDLANKREYEKSELSLQECKKRSSNESSMIEGQLVACFENQTDDLTTQLSALLIYEWDGSRFNEVASTSCSFCYWSVDKSHKAIFVSEDHAQQTGETGVDRWLSIYKRPFDRERTLFISGSCKAFDVYEMSYVEDGIIRFQLTTDCSSVTINNRQITFRPKEENGKKSTAYYLLTLGEDGLPIALDAQR